VSACLRTTVSISAGK